MSRVAAAAVLACVVVMAAGCGSEGGADNPASSPSAAAAAAPHYETNARGQTYGSGDVTDDRQLPDLIQAYGDGGKLGYITREALLNSVPRPGQSTAPSHTVPLFSNDGITQIGTYTFQ